MNSASHGSHLPSAVRTVAAAAAATEVAPPAAVPDSIIAKNRAGKKWYPWYIPMPPAAPHSTSGAVSKSGSSGSRDSPVPLSSREASQCGTNSRSNSPGNAGANTASPFKSPLDADSSLVRPSIYGACHSPADGTRAWLPQQRGPPNTDDDWYYDDETVNLGGPTRPTTADMPRVTAALSLADVYRAECRRLGLKKPNSAVLSQLPSMACGDAVGDVDPNSLVEYLDFRSTYLGPKGCLAVAAIFPFCPNLRRVDLSATGLTANDLLASDDGTCARAVLWALQRHCRRLESLDVSSNPINDAGARWLLALLRLVPSLRHLDITGTFISRPAARRIVGHMLHRAPSGSRCEWDWEQHGERDCHGGMLDSAADRDARSAAAATASCDDSYDHDEWEVLLDDHTASPNRPPRRVPPFAAAALVELRRRLIRNRHCIQRVYDCFVLPESVQRRVSMAATAVPSHRTGCGISKAAARSLVHMELLGAELDEGTLASVQQGTCSWKAFFRGLRVLGVNSAARTLAQAIAFAGVCGVLCSETVQFGKLLNMLRVHAVLVTGDGEGESVRRLEGGAELLAAQLRWQGTEAIYDSSPGYVHGAAVIQGDYFDANDAGSAARAASVDEVVPEGVNRYHNMPTSASTDRTAGSRATSADSPLYRHAATAAQSRGGSTTAPLPKQLSCPSPIAGELPVNSFTGIGLDTGLEAPTGAGGGEAARSSSPHDRATDGYGSISLSVIPSMLHSCADAIRSVVVTNATDGPHGWPTGAAGGQVSSPHRGREGSVSLTQSAGDNYFATYRNSAADPLALSNLSEWGAAANYLTIDSPPRGSVTAHQQQQQHMGAATAVRSVTGPERELHDLVTSGGLTAAVSAEEVQFVMDRLYDARHALRRCLVVIVQGMGSAASSSQPSSAQGARDTSSAASRHYPSGFSRQSVDLHNSVLASSLFLSGSLPLLAATTPCGGTGGPGDGSSIRRISVSASGTHRGRRVHTAEPSRESITSTGPSSRRISRHAEGEDPVAKSSSPSEEEEEEEIVADGLRLSVYSPKRPDTTRTGSAGSPRGGRTPNKPAVCHWPVVEAQDVDTSGNRDDSCFNDAAIASEDDGNDPVQGTPKEMALDSLPKRVKSTGTARSASGVPPPPAPAAGPALVPMESLYELCVAVVGAERQGVLQCVLGRCGIDTGDGDLLVDYEARLLSRLRLCGGDGRGSALPPLAAEAVAHGARTRREGRPGSAFARVAGAVSNRDLAPEEAGHVWHSMTVKELQCLIAPF